MVKYALLSLISLTTMLPIFSMQSPLTTVEENCFNWLDNAIGLKEVAYNALSEEDRKAWIFAEDTASLTAVVPTYIKEIYKAAEKAGIEVPYNETTLVKTVMHVKKLMRNKEIIKPVDRITARMYVFSSLLTPEEQASVYENNYKANPAAASAAMLKNGKLLAEELAKLGIIENTPQAKEQEAQLFHAKKMEAFKQTYKTE